MGTKNGKKSREKGKLYLRANALPPTPFFSSIPSLSFSEDMLEERGRAQEEFVFAASMNVQANFPNMRGMRGIFQKLMHNMERDNHTVALLHLVRSCTESVR